MSSDEDDLLELSERLDELEGRIGRLENDESLSGRLDELKGQLDELDELKDGTAWLEDVTLAVIYTLGAALGMILSWSRNASVLWCILHGMFSWVYVVYFAVTR